MTTKATVWLERPLPQKYSTYFDGLATVLVAGDMANLAAATAVIAGGKRPFAGDFMDQAPNLKLIARYGIGVDNVDVAAATARGIAVTNTPDAPTISTAEHAMALIFAVARNLKWTNRQLELGTESSYSGKYRGLELHGKTLGIVGLGRIGSHVAKIAAGIGMKIVAFDPYVDESHAAELQATLLPTLESLLQTADIVTLHLPRTPQTVGLINAERLQLMQPTAVLINVARGGIVDEEALAAALDAGQLWGAGVDVFTVEPPPPDHPLVGREDVVVSPHIASATIAGADRLWRDTLAEVRRFLQGKRPLNLVNPEVWP